MRLRLPHPTPRAPRIPPAQVVEMIQQYDGAGATLPNCQVSASTPRQPVCTISFAPHKAMKAPIYVYYELQNFYQNHRRYVSSKADKQLSGGVSSIVTSADSSLLSTCDPLKTGANNKVLHPCGLIANSYFSGACGRGERGGRAPSCRPRHPQPPLAPPTCRHPTPRLQM